jgi:hypothetical protein
MASIDPDHLQYVPLVLYNGTNAAGGDSLTEDLNIFYNVSWTELADFSYHSILTKICSGWRYRMDDHIDRFGLAHDSRCRVCASNNVFVPSKKSNNSRAVSSILVSHDESPPCPSSGFPSWQPRLSLSNGSSGVTRSHSRTPLESTLVTWRTLASEMSWARHPLVPQRFLISCSPCTRECSRPLL